VQGKYRFRSVLYPRKIGRVRAAALILAALAVGLLLSACGGGGNGELLPGATADQITSNLDQVQASYENGDCEKAETAVAQVSTEVDDLNKVDVELKKALKNGALKLSEVVNSCGEAEEAEEAKAEEKAEEEEQAQIEGEEAEAEAEEEAFLEEQKEEERDQKAEEKAEKEAEKAEPPTGGEESPKGEAKGLEKQEEETVPPPTESEEVTPPAPGGGPAGGVGPGAAVEGGE
jgi:membrane protein involved in colicin uptake